MTPEMEKAFWESMRHCGYTRADGKPAKCLDPQQHNMGCANCPVSAKLCEPDAFEEETK